MSILPDDLWNRIMEIGIGTKSLDYKAICRLSITCRRLRRLAGDDSVWSPLLLSDFASSSKDLDLIRNDHNYIIDENRNSDSTVNGKFKSLYKIRYEKEVAHRRFVLRIESEIAESLSQIRERELQSAREKEKMKETIAELRNLRNAR